MIEVISVRENVLSEKCPLGKMSGWGSLLRGSPWSRKCPVLEESIREVSIGDLSLEKCPSGTARLENFLDTSLFTT